MRMVNGGVNGLAGSNEMCTGMRPGDRNIRNNFNLLPNPPGLLPVAHGANWKGGSNEWESVGWKTPEVQSVPRMNFPFASNLNEVEAKGNHL